MQVSLISIYIPIIYRITKKTDKIVKDIIYLLAVDNTYSRLRLTVALIGARWRVFGYQLHAH